MGKYRYDDWDDDLLIPVKHKKKKKTKKSTHKHLYKEFIGESISPVRDTPYFVLAKKCEICGKIEIVNSFLTVKIPNSCLVRLFPTRDEVIEMFPDLVIEPLDEEW